jgi:hypothetical protein
MKTTGRMPVTVLLGMLLALAIVGCDATTEDTEATSDVSGSWLYSDTDGRQSTWALVQSDDGTVDGAGTGGEVISGSVVADSIYVSLSYSSSNMSAALSGAVSGSTMGGAFTNSVTGGGSWTAVKTN